MEALRVSIFLRRSNVFFILTVLFAISPIGNARELIPVSYDSFPIFVPTAANCSDLATNMAEAGAFIQDCIDITPDGGVLELPAGTYIVDQELSITKSITIKTKNLNSSAAKCLSFGINCAILKASPDVYNTFLIVKHTSAVTIDHVVFDGNRSARQQFINNCTAGSTLPYNVTVYKCIGCTLNKSASINAACGTGMEWHGDNATITSNTFRDNGSLTPAGSWADGLTVHHAHNSTITNNTFIDNSDVDFIIGNGQNTLIAGNSVSHSKQAAFAGIMLHTWGYSPGGDFTGAVLENNSVTCNIVGCHFGILLGSHPWVGNLPNAIGGTIKNNTVTGWETGINVDGFGSLSNKVTLTGNNVSGGINANFCGHPGSPRVNVNTADSYQSGLAAGSYTTYSYHDCPIAP